jgi:hypothetical protein
VLLGYTAISFLYFGLRVAEHPGRLLIGIGGDPQIFVWSIAWWPHAILHGTNPFVSHAIWAPDGLNLAWTTSIPGVAVAVAPLTLLFGPVVAYNVAAILLPALAAWTAFLLCRHLTGSLWPSLAGGYLFGFSSYMLGQELGHVHMTAVFLVPLVALVALRYVEGELGAAGFAWRLGALLGAQLYLSTEVFFTISLALAVGVALAWLIVPETRARLSGLARPVLGGYAIAAAIGSPLLAYALSDFETGTLNPPKDFSADLLNFVVPTRLVAIGGGTAASLVDRFPAFDSERGAYLGLPVLLIAAWFAWSDRHRPGARFLTAALLVSIAAALGTSLWVGGHRVTPLPWDLLSRLPLFDNVLPVRLALFTSLAAAVIVALWSADPSRQRWLRTLLPVLAVLALLPTLRQADWRSHPDRPEFFAHPELVKACLPPNENVLIYPYGYRDSSMLWQAENDFYFRMAEGYLRPDTPDSFAHFPAVYKTLNGGPDPTVPEILGLAIAKDVARILSVQVYAHPSAAELQSAGLLVQLYGGVDVAPACGHPPLTHP